MQSWRDRLNSRLFFGRYGLQPFSIGLFVVACLMALWGITVSHSPMTFISAGFLLGYAIWRCLSRNTVRRGMEEQAVAVLMRRFHQWTIRWTAKLRRALRMPWGVKRPRSGATDPEHQIIRCPSCKGRLRIPKKKGLLRVRCTHCQHRFETRS